MGQLPLARAMKKKASERGTKGFYNVVRNNDDWDEMRESYKDILRSES